MMSGEESGSRTNEGTLGYSYRYPFNRCSIPLISFILLS